MKPRAMVVGGVCFLLGGLSLALAQTSMRPDQFIATAWTWTGIQTFVDGKLSLAGATSGNSVLKAPATGGGTITLPAGSGTLAYAAGGTSPGGTSGQLQYNNAGSFGGFALAGDCTFAQPTITCTKTSGVTFGTAAVANTGTSGATLPFVNGSNTWSKAQAVTPVPLTPGAGTIAVDASTSNGFTLTIGNDSNVLGNPSNLKPGQSLNVELTVGSGGHTGFSTGTNYKYAGAIAPAWSTAAGKIDVLSCWAVTSSLLQCSGIIDVR